MVKNSPFGDTPKEKKLYKKGIKEGIKHSSPSPETKKFMEDISRELGEITEGLKNVIKVMDTNHIENNESFNGVYKRQDHTNGNVTDLQLKNAKTEGMYKIFSIIFSIILLPVIVAIITTFISLRDQSIRQDQYNKSIEDKLNQLTIDHSNMDNEIKSEATAIAKQEIDNFANKNFNQYNK